MSELEDVIKNCIDEVYNNICKMANPIYKQERTQLAKDIFNSKGKTHRRNWQENTNNTAKNKGFNHRNVDTGILEKTLTSNDDFLDDVAYFDKLVGINEGYKYANSIGAGQNRFDDIGQTEEDKEEILNNTVSRIAKEYV